MIKDSIWISDTEKEKCKLVVTTAKQGNECN